MLKFLRKNTRFIVWVVVISFVIWGGYAVSVQFEEAQRAPGRIAGKEVSFREYLAANRAVRIFSLTPPQKEGEPQPAELEEALTWQFLILSREAGQRRIKVTDEEVRQEIARLLTERGGEMLSREQYFQWVRSTFGEEPREFEDQVRDELRIQKLLKEVRQGFAENPERRFQRWMTALFRKTKVAVYNRQP